jgi:hypothetical protein
MQLMAAKRAQEAAQKADAAGLFLFWFEQVDVAAGGRSPPPRSHNTSRAARRSHRSTPSTTRAP